MAKCFNVTGACDPSIHYMVDIKDRLIAIEKMVDEGLYFTINRARQYGKTTTLRALAEYLKDKYAVISMDFQKLGNADFADEQIFCDALAESILRTINKKRNPVVGLDKDILDAFQEAQRNKEISSFRKLFVYLSDLCDTSEKPVVLMIDEVDSATNNQVFLDFLAQLRADYLDRRNVATFQSVILAGVTDVKNLKTKIRLEEAHKINSPWNIATDFLIDMSFSTGDISNMLQEYKRDNDFQMDEDEIAEEIYEYTSGYPFLVSRLCQLMDERLPDNTELFESKADVWTKRGVLEAVKLLESEKNTLFDSLSGKLQDYPNLKEMLYTLLFQGKDISYSSLDRSIDVAMMFGFVKEKNNRVVIANRIFESILYNLFLVEEQMSNRIYDLALIDRSRFVVNGVLDMEKVLEKFATHFTDIYGGSEERFVEDNGRRLFLLYLKPIINGTGNYYVESETRDKKRTDVIVDYRGRQYVIEMKIWHGQEYNERGEKQLAEYLDYYHLDKGYMLSFNFNKNKQVGVKTVEICGKEIIEAVV